MTTFNRKNFALGLGCLSLVALVQASSQDPYPSSPLLGSATTDQVYTPVTPCRFVDGINANDRVPAPAGLTTARYYRVRGNTAADFVSQGAASSAPTGCGIPTSATSVMVNFTVADPDADGDLRVDPSDVSTPSSTSVLNYTFGGARGKNLANGVIVKLCDLTVGSCASGATPTSPTRDILVTFHAGASPVSTYLIADVLGYFAPALVDTAAIQARVTGTCPAGQSISSIGANGAVVCEVDNSFANCTWARLATATSLAVVSATCPAGKNVVSGGCDALGTEAVVLTRPFGPPVNGDAITVSAAWRCEFSVAAIGHTAYALCCNVQ